MFSQASLRATLPSALLASKAVEVVPTLEPSSIHSAILMGGTPWLTLVPVATLKTQFH